MVWAPSGAPMLEMLSGAPIRTHNFISCNNIFNILPYLCEKPPYNIRKCGKKHALSCGVGAVVVAPQEGVPR